MSGPIYRESIQSVPKIEHFIPSVNGSLGQRGFPTKQSSTDMSASFLRQLVRPCLQQATGARRAFSTSPMARDDNIKKTYTPDESFNNIIPAKANPPPPPSSTPTKPHTDVDLEARWRANARIAYDNITRFGVPNAHSGAPFQIVAERSLTSIIKGGRSQ